MVAFPFIKSRIARTSHPLKSQTSMTNGGSLTYKKRYAPTTRLLTPYCDPLHQPKTHVFTKECHIFPHCPKFWKFFTQRPQISWNLRKWTQILKFFLNIFMAFVTERSHHFLPCMHVF